MNTIRQAQAAIKEAAQPQPPKLFIILEFTHTAGEVLPYAHEMHVVAATTQALAVREAKHAGLTFHPGTFVFNDEAAERGGSLMRNVLGWNRGERMSVEEYEHFKRVYSDTYDNIDR